MCSRVMASSAPKGSSIISTSGSSARARAMDTRWRMPPDSCAGYRSAAYSRPTRRSSSSARSRCRSRGTASTSAISEQTFSSAVFQGISAASWNTMPTRRCRTSPGGTPATETSPPVGGTSPANTFSSVLLPQPEGPMMEVNEPSRSRYRCRSTPARNRRGCRNPRSGRGPVSAPPGAPPPAPGRARRMHSPACPWPASTRGHGRRESRPLLDARHPLPQMRQLGLGMGNFRQRRAGARQMSAREKASPATQGRPARCPSSSDSSADSSLAAASLQLLGRQLGFQKPAR